MQKKILIHIIFLIFSAFLLPFFVYANSSPKEFSASIGGFLGASYKVVWDGSVILYSYNPNTFTSGPDTQTEKIIVSEDAWSKFRKEIDSSDIWDWKSNYDNPDIADGTVWHVHLSYSDRSTDSRGSNTYPSKEKFEKFLAAVRTLIGKEFK